MPTREIAAKELANIFKILAHPDRVRLVEELRAGEKDVNTLHEVLGLRAARVSQHLALMRAHRLVEERRDGRHHYYHLTQPDIADWVVDGLVFLQARIAASGVNKTAIEQARELWTSDTPPEQS